MLTRRHRITDPRCQTPALAIASATALMLDLTIELANNSIVRLSVLVAESRAREAVCRSSGLHMHVRLRRVGLAGSPSANDLLGVRHPVSPAERLSGFWDWLNPVAWPLARVGDPSHCPATSPEAVSGEMLVWTDGACQRNPGPGGWAALLCWEDGVVEEHSGGLAHTTNNIMEMIAALEGLRALPSGSRACVVTDSRYLHDGMTSWMAGWKRKDWKTASGDPVKNKEIWVQLDVAASDHEQVRWHWVKGHIGHALNERADVLAVAATRNAARSGR